MSAYLLLCNSGNEVVSIEYIQMLSQILIGLFSRVNFPRVTLYSVKELYSWTDWYSQCYFCRSQVICKENVIRKMISFSHVPWNVDFIETNYKNTFDYTYKGEDRETVAGRVRHEEHRDRWDSNRGHKNEENGKYMVINNTMYVCAI